MVLDSPKVNYIEFKTCSNWERALAKKKNSKNNKSKSTSVEKAGDLKKSETNPSSGDDV
ncbi:hypothetical protein M901_3183, partial [Bacteriovorax sp. DB6_IX]